MNFDGIWNILEDSFEEELHRTYEEHYNLLVNNKYKINTYEENDKCIGFISFWTFDKFIYIEHFAVDKKARGKGIGKKILTDMLNLKGLKILEVELPNTEIDKKRIKFYEDFGFVVNSQEYYQPPYRKGGDKIKLLVMSTNPLDNNFFDEATKQIHKHVYFS